VRWDKQTVEQDRQTRLPGYADAVTRTFDAPEALDIRFHEIHTKSALNRVPEASRLPFGWTVNPYRGCTHACVYCFARPTHEYLEYDAGRDFEREIIVKVNVPEVLRVELSRPSWKGEHVALGTNTDPYQRAEGRYELMPGIIAALADSGTPFSILTKGSLVRRDLPALVAANEVVPVDLSMSIAVYDEELQRAVEPGTPSTQARLATVRAARDAGIPVTVFLMPILPYLTDTRAHLDDALARIAEAGASGVLHTALHLRPGVKEWFMEWLAQTHPEVVPRYRAMYGGGAYAPKDYRAWLAAKISPLMRKHGLARGLEEPATGTLRSRALRTPRDLGALQEIGPSPTLF
jgi:DNA repair photolyase